MKKRVSGNGCVPVLALLLVGLPWVAWWFR